jgi:hypothetical protein
MIERVGSDNTVVILPDGDFVSGEVLVVDVSGWSSKDLFALDECPRSERAGLAQMIDAIRKAEGMSVVEVSLKRGNTPRW